MLFTAFRLAEMFLLCDQHGRTTAQLQIYKKKVTDIPKTKLNIVPATSCIAAVPQTKCNVQ
jgi:hypothetical protein